MLFITPYLQITFKMSNTYTETILFNLPLPPVLITFKDKINSLLLPRLTQIIADIEKKQQNSSIVTLLCLIVIILLIREIIGNLFKVRGKGQGKPSRPVVQAQVDEEIRALGAQIRNLKNSLKKIIQGAGKQGSQKPIQKMNEGSGYKTQDINRLINYYREAAQDFNNLADYILDTQESIFKQIKNLKKLRGPTEKTSSHGSRDDNNSELYERNKDISEMRAIEDRGVVFDTVKMEDKGEKMDVQETEREEVEERSPEPVVVPRPIPKAIRPPTTGPGLKKRVAPPPPPTR